MTSSSLWNYYRDKIDDVDDKASWDKSFEYKAKITGKHQNDHHSHHQIQVDLYHHNHECQP